MPIFESDMICAGIIALLAVCVLASPKPSISAIFLFFESLLITINLFIIDEARSDFLASSILLTFLVMIACGNNIFLEISYKNPTTRPLRIAPALGGILIIIFWAKIEDLFIPESVNKNLDQHFLVQDGLTLIIIGFSLFAILVSTLTIFDIKPSKSRTPV